MTRHLRLSFGEPKTGLILANGGWLTHEYTICLSSRPRKDHSPYPDKNPLPELTTDWFVPPVDEVVEGDASIEVTNDFPTFFPVAIPVLLFFFFFA